MHPQFTPAFIARFWTKVNKDGPLVLDTPCWLWTGHRPHGKYGRVFIKKCPLLTHRVSYELTFGSLPAKKHVLHRCDNPPCVRPDHLFLGTALDNAKDRMRKGRGRVYDFSSELKPPKPPHGDYTTHAKVKTEDIPVIRRRYAEESITTEQLGRIYGVTHNAISNIIKRRTWRHIP